jgi:hypothetical protein
MKRLQTNASLSFQDAQGSGSFPNSNWGIVLGSSDTIYTPQYVSPLSYNNMVKGSVNIDYRFGKNDGGPILQELGASLLFTFNSGHPYTRSTFDAPGNGDPRSRYPTQPLNSSTTPWVSQVNLRIDKTIHLVDQLSATFSLFIINLLDAKNVDNVWLGTGSADDDGYLSDPARAAQLTQAYGPRYVDMYREIAIGYGSPDSATGFMSPYFYGAPRQIRLSIRLEY